MHCMCMCMCMCVLCVCVCVRACVQMLACCCCCSCYFYLRRCCKPGTSAALHAAKLEPADSGGVEMVAGCDAEGVSAAEHDDGAWDWESWHARQEGVVIREPIATSPTATTTSDRPPQRPLPRRPVPPPKPAHLLRTSCETTTATGCDGGVGAAGVASNAAAGVSTDRVKAVVWQVRERDREEKRFAGR